MSDVVFTDTRPFVADSVDYIPASVPPDVSMGGHRTAKTNFASDRFVISNGSTVWLFTVPGYDELFSAPSGVGTIRGVDVSPDGQTVIVVGSSAPYIQVFDGAGNAQPSPISLSTSAYDVAFAPDGQSFAVCVSASNNQGAYVYSLAGAPIAITNTAALYSDGGRSVAFDDAGSYLWVGLRSAASGQDAAAVIEVATMTATALDTSTLATAQQDGYVVPTKQAGIAFYYSTTLRGVGVYSATSGLQQILPLAGIVNMRAGTCLSNGDLLLAGDVVTYTYRWSVSEFVEVFSKPLLPDITWLSSRPAQHTPQLAVGSVLDDAGVGFATNIDLYRVGTGEFIASLDSDGTGAYSQEVLGNQEVQYIAYYKDNTYLPIIDRAPVRQIGTVSWVGAFSYTQPPRDAVDFVWEARFLRPQQTTSDTTLSKFVGGSGLQDTVSTGEQDDASSLVLQTPGTIVIKLTAPYIEPDPLNDMEIMLRGMVELGGTVLDIHLMQGAATRQQWLGEEWTPGVVENHRYVLSQAAKDAITNWGNLSLKIEVTRNAV